MLHVDTGREMRGGQHQVQSLMEALRAEGHRCSLLAPTDSPLALVMREAGFDVAAPSLWEVWQRSGTVDIVHAHDARAHAAAAIASQAAVVVARRVSFPIGTSWLSRWKYRRACRYLAVSRFVAGKLVEAGIAPEKIDVVFDGVEISGTPVIWDRKQAALAPAFRNDPKKLSQMTSEACRLAGIELVFSSDLRRDLEKAAVFVYLTETEGLGSAVLLAMAQGVPVVASRVEGLAEVFEHESTGLYARNRAEEVAAMIRRVLDEPKLACQLRCAARERVEKQFSLRQLVDGTLGCYERALVD